MRISKHKKFTKRKMRSIRPGRKCPNCSGTLERASKLRNPKKHQLTYVHCRGCNFTNF